MLSLWLTQLFVKNVVMVTINVPNLPSAPATKLDLHEDGFKFAAKVGDQAKGIAERSYAFDLDLFDKIDVENSKVSQSSKSMYLLLRKKEAKLEYWPRLSKEKVRLHNVKTDFDKVSHHLQYMRDKYQKLSLICNLNAVGRRGRAVGQPR